MNLDVPSLISAFYCMQVIEIHCKWNGSIFRGPSITKALNISCCDHFYMFKMLQYNANKKLRAKAI